MTTIGILGSGTVARVLADGLTKAGHTVLVGSRAPEGPTAATWAGVAGVTLVSTAEAARTAEVVVNATPGPHSLDVLTPLSAELAGKILIDVANATVSGPDGMASSLVYPETSLAEEIQRALPETRVVKTLNTMGPASVMADPASLSLPPVAFLSGDEGEAKKKVTELLSDLGWPAEWIIDLGAVTTARVPEEFILLVRPLIHALGPVPFGMAIGR